MEKRIIEAPCIVETVANEEGEILYLKEPILEALNMNSAEIAICNGLLSYPHILVAIITDRLHYSDTPLEDCRLLLMKAWSTKHRQRFWVWHYLRPALIEDIEAYNCILNLALDSIDEHELVGPPSLQKARG